MNNPFVRDTAGYVRDIDIIENYIKTAGQYLSTSTGKSVEEAMDWIRKNINPVDPILKTLARRDGADRVKEKQGLTSYLKETLHSGRLLGPNLIMYENPAKKLSFLSEFIEVGMDKRSVVKKKGQKAYMDGDTDTATFCDNQQVKIKTLNNTLSGAHASPHNPIFNPSAHTTLTSVCRCATTYSNAVVEKLLAGNRHYYSPEIALADMASIIRITDLKLVEEALEKYSLVSPSAESLLLQVLSSCHQYWFSDDGEHAIYTFIFAMDDIERAAVSYVMDLNAVKDNNDMFMRVFIENLIKIPEYDPNAKYENLDANSDMVAMVGLITAGLLKGRTVKVMAKEDPISYHIYQSVTANVIDTFNTYSDFIKAFIATDNMPTGIHSVPVALRKVAIVSDTDSTIFTTEKWVEWYTGGKRTGPTAMAVAGTIAYIDTQALAHTLAQLSRHLGVEDSKLFRLAMKSEFFMPVLGVTNLTKHYFSYVKACEGNVYPKAKLDTKGVNLKNSRLPKNVTGTLRTYIEWIMDSMLENKKPTLASVLETPAKLAHEIVASLKQGKTQYLMSAQIKPIGAYKNPNAPAFVQYTLWQSVFSTLYGLADTPPYSVVKVPVTLHKRSELEAWAEGVPAELQRALHAWLLRDVKHVVSRRNNVYEGVTGPITLNNKDTVLVSTRSTPICGPMGRIFQYGGGNDTITISDVDFNNDPSWVDIGGIREGFTNFMVPRTRLVNDLIPEHIATALDLDRIESEMMSGFMVAMETTGLYYKNSSNSRLLSKEIDISIYDTEEEKK